MKAERHERAASLGALSHSWRFACTCTVQYRVRAGSVPSRCVLALRPPSVEICHATVPSTARLHHRRRYSTYSRYRTVSSRATAMPRFPIDGSTHDCASGQSMFVQSSPVQYSVNKDITTLCAVRRRKSGKYARTTFYTHLHRHGMGSTISLHATGQPFSSRGRPQRYCVPRIERRDHGLCLYAFASAEVRES
nr:hypothetical protein CFP56_53699 [Quercus suber]